MAKQPADRVRKRVQQLVARAARLDIDPHFLARYAELHAISELRTQGEKENAADREEADVGFTKAVFGLPDDLDRASVERFVRKVRKRYERIEQSARGAVLKLKRFAQVLDKEGGDLPERLKLDSGKRYVLKVAGLIEQFRLQLKVDLQIEKSIRALIQRDPNRRMIPRTTSQRTLLLWHRDVDDYQEKWNDMLELANRWNISTINGLDDFKRYVRKLNRRFPTFS